MQKEDKENRMDRAAADYLKESMDINPVIGIVLGSGLNDIYKIVECPKAVPYKDIPGFPVSTVEGHAGRFIFGSICGVEVVLMQGRVHFYEGYSMEQVVVPIRVMGRLGVKTLILTNAAGGIRDDLDAGDMMIITDHITSFVPSPLIGRNDDSLGVRFPDMSHVYCREYIEMLENIMESFGIPVHKGVYLQTTGPQYETPAEIRMFRMLGADAVGMSTACEAVTACHMGMKVMGLSTISNKAAGLGTELNHKDIIEMGAEMAEKVNKIIVEAVKRLSC